MNIEIISGSPRQESVTKRVALHLEKLLREKTDHHVDIIDLKEHHLPILDAVYKTIDDVPLQYRGLAERMFAADAFILLTPEYNGSYTPAMKNLLDHFPKQTHKTFGIVTASHGALGGMRAAIQLQQLVYALFGIGSPYMLLVPGVDKKFSMEGELLDASFQKNIEVFTREFLWLAEKLAAEKIEV